MPHDDMGVLNAGWGICGFTSSLYALYTHSRGQRSRLARGGRTTSNMLAEIKSYLRVLQADGRYDILDSIKTFTRSFGGRFATFTIERYITRINNIVTLSDQEIIDLKDDEIFGIAMPPAAVVDYLKRICDFQGARLVTSDKSEMVIGVCGTALPMYNGLEHYVYYLNGTVYSWGLQFGSVREAAASQRTTWTVGYRIAIG